MAKASAIARASPAITTKSAIRSTTDLIIAATASTHGLTVVSRDASEFERARVSVFNPWNDKTE